MGKPRRERMADRYEITHQQRDLCRRRVAYLLEPLNDGPKRRLIDLLANAYAQGLDDAVQVMERRAALEAEKTGGELE